MSCIGSTNKGNPNAGEIGSKEWANETLRFCIATLQGKIEVSKVKARISTCLYLKGVLAETGFWWQVKILDHWIHRAQGGEFDDL